MYDACGRRINYLRVSVTDRCNLRCLYCMPEDGVSLRNHREMLSYEEILRVIRALASMGVDRVRVTGGEPLVRKGLTDFLAEVWAIQGIRDLSLTTNGILLAPMAADLKRAGVGRLNISLDTLKAERFSQSTRGGDLDRVLAGLDKALSLGFEPVKLNMVVIRGLNDDEIEEMARLTLSEPIHVRYIELMPLGESFPWAPEKFISAHEIRDRLSEKWELAPVGGGTGVGGRGEVAGGRTGGVAGVGGMGEVAGGRTGEVAGVDAVGSGVVGAGPAEYYRLPGARGAIGFISPISEHFCHTCNRIRLSADGKINPCLGSLSEVDLKPTLRSVVVGEEARREQDGEVKREPKRELEKELEKELERQLRRAVLAKPRRHQMVELNADARGRRMSGIGG